VEVPSLCGPRYFVLNRRDKCVCIWNGYPFHWEQPPIVCSHYTVPTNYAQVFRSLHIGSHCRSGCDIYEICREE
jgi:hypothetical protein